MAKKQLSKIFLSASIPDPNRDKIYFDTADIVAIRDSVKALATVVIPHAHLIWGGHPSITPLIRFVMQRMHSDIRQHVTLYQSNFFRNVFPADNFHFEDVVVIDESGDMEHSLSAMRLAMLGNNKFDVGISIGGMKGVINEYKQFITLHPHALVLPIASTGAAARIIYGDNKRINDPRLANDYSYMALFKDILSNYLDS